MTFNRMSSVIVLCLSECRRAFVKQWHNTNVPLNMNAILKHKLMQIIELHRSDYMVRTWHHKICGEKEIKKMKTNMSLYRNVENSHSVDRE